MYDVRCTIWGVPALAREFGGCRRLCTRYNTHDDPKQLRGSCSCTMLDVRCTIAIIARFARGFSRSKCGRALMKLCAECGVAFVVASPVGLCYNPTAGAATRQKKKMSNTITRRMQAACWWCFAHPWHTEQLVYLALLALYRL